MARRPKYTSRQITRHGKPIWYFRRNGRRIRLPDEFGTEEWWTAYDAALRGKRVQRPQSRGRFSHLITDYLDSPAFNGLARNTMAQRRRILLDAAEKAGNANPEQITDTSIKQVMQTRPPFAANNFLKAMRGFYKWAIAMGHVDTDPTQGVARNNPKTEGWKIWTPEYIEKFRDYWELQIRLFRDQIGTDYPFSEDDHKHINRAKCVLACFNLALATGLRRSDLIRVKGKHFFGTHIQIRAEKTGVMCYIPVEERGGFQGYPEIRYLDWAAENEPYLRRESGKPFTSAETLGNWFRDACKEAGIPDGIRLHSLRKTAATLDAEDGWTANELMAKYGWLDIREAELYTRQADRKNLALGAGKR